MQPRVRGRLLASSSKVPRRVSGPPDTCMSDSAQPATPPPVESADEFLSLVRASGLIPRARLGEVEAAVSPWRAVPGPIPEGCQVALINGNLLTEWQIRRLLKRAGRDNFFLDAFKLLKPLGQGGMGSVFLAEFLDPEEQGKSVRVAIKLLPKRLQEKGQYLNRFNQENWVAARLHHENIARAWDDFSESKDDTPYHYSVMDYIEGDDLDRLVRKNGPLSATTAADFIQQAAKGLHYAHSQGFVHRDIKPANLMLETATGQVKILDFGLVQTDEDDEKSRAIKNDERRKSLGTPDYMSPEQAAAQSVDHRSDIYSLGCTFYFLLTGRPPFDHVMGEPGSKGGTRDARMAAHIGSPPPNLLEKRPNLPAKLVDLVQRMMAKAPRDRPQSAQDVDDALFMLSAGYELAEFDQQEAADAVKRGAPPPPTADSLSAASVAISTAAPARPINGASAASGTASAAGNGSSLGGSVAPSRRSNSSAGQADTPPLSSSARSTGRMPAAAQPHGAATGAARSTTRTEAARHPPTVQQTAVAMKNGKRSVEHEISPAETGWLARTVAGLPVAAWIAMAVALGVLILIVAIRALA